MTVTTKLATLGGAALIVASALGLAGPAAADTPTPTPTVDTNPYAQHPHVPGDEDSDPTWVYIAGGVFVLVIGGGLTGLLLFIRRIPPTQPD